MADEANDYYREAYDYYSENILIHNNSLFPDDDSWDPSEYWSLYYSISIGCPIAIFVGVFANIFAFVVLVRSRLWLKHEGYVYLAANFCANVGILLFCISSFWLTSVYGWWYNYYPPNTSAFMCKVWHFIMSIFFASGWLSVALLFNVYLREHLISRRRCGCPMFAAKYCTLFASKIIVGVIFSVGLLFVLGIPYLAIYKNFADGECYPSSEHIDFRVVKKVEEILMRVLPIVFFLPIILLMTLCTCRKRESNIVGFSQIEERSVNDQMRVVAVTLSSMTLLSQLFLVSIRQDYRKNLITRVTIVAELLFAFSLGLQPILCFVILKALHDGFRFQLRDIRCCRRLFPPLDREEEVVQLSAIQEDPPIVTES